jgi:predicted glycoside hydrolase/deacetylase ChbG (UPF0249 family)
VSAKRLIVTADDLGLSAEANAAVGALHQGGMVTSASLTVTGAAAGDAAALASLHPGLSIGLLLALTGLQAAAARRDVASLVDGRGMLPADLEGLARARPALVLLEARAQLRRFRELLRREPSHLALLDPAAGAPGAVEAVVVLSWETGLPVRSASRELRERLRRERVPTPDHFVDEWWRAGGPVGLVRTIAELPVATSELRCLAAHAEQRQALLDFEARSAIQATGVKLTAYAALAAPPASR